MFISELTPEAVKTFLNVKINIFKSKKNSDFQHNANPV